MNLPWAWGLIHMFILFSHPKWSCKLHCQITCTLFSSKHAKPVKAVGETYCTVTTENITSLLLEVSHYFLKFISDISSVISRSAKTKTKFYTSNRKALHPLCCLHRDMYYTGVMYCQIQYSGYECRTSALMSNRQKWILLLLV